MITEAEWSAYVRGRRDVKSIPGIKGIGLAGPDVITYVEKITPEILRELPETLDGIPLKVKQVGKLKILPLDIQAAYSGRGTVSRPVVGGMSVGSYYGDTGTHGCVVGYGGQRVGISNNHVVALQWGERRDGNLGDPVLQPGAVDYPAERLEIGALIGYSQVPLSSEGSNSVDAAIFTGDFSDEVAGLGAPAPSVRMEPGMKVWKSGRTTGVTSGIIETVGAVVDIEGFGEARFENVAITDRGMSAPGDSGSLVVNNWAQSCGLVFAGGEGATVVCEAREVERKLGVTFGVRKPTELEAMDGIMTAYTEPHPLMAQDVASSSNIWAPVLVGGMVLLYLTGRK